MSSSASDRNLLFGSLALQLDFIAREQLIAGMNQWVLEKQTPLEQVLLRQGALKERDLALLVPLVANGKAELSAQEKAEREKYTQLAVDTLGEAIEAGYKDVERIKKDAALAAIREHPRYEQLVEELEKRAKDPKEPAPPAAKPSEPRPAEARRHGPTPTVPRSGDRDTTCAGRAIADRQAGRAALTARITSRSA